MPGVMWHPKQHCFLSFLMCTSVLWRLESFHCHLVTFGMLMLFSNIKRIRPYALQCARYSADTWSGTWFNIVMVYVVWLWDSAAGMLLVSHVCETQSES